MTKFAVVAVTYNRPHSLKRLLNSLQSAYYDNDKVDLIISVDKSEIETEIIELSKNYNWEYGDKKIRTFDKRQGLKNHILQCGDLVENYDAVIIFEDDLIASKNYYIYAKQALEYYNNDDHIAGISLYLHKRNFINGLPFSPLETGSDVFFMQCAQSWGQCWSRSMWSSFKEWHQSNNVVFYQDDRLPKKILKWPISSWLKYYMKYIVDTNRFFVYPYTSLSTNMTDAGQHNTSSTDAFQVSLLHDRKDYKFIDLKEGIKYDIYFEFVGIEKYLSDKISEDNLCVDLYSRKENNNKCRYILTRKRLNYNIVKSYGLHMRPHENNIIYKISGNDIFLYDTKKDDSQIIIDGKFDLIKESKYYTVSTWKHSILYGVANLISIIKDKIKDKIKNKIKNKIKK
ncbi:MAG: glycosyltransferase family A protein [Candidatus Delongbacteria bacterium]|jgi:hypothetical protein|nr:glycosyltransferase family A protein [Candidatus Delongbacteria bacterium]